MSRNSSLKAAIGAAAFALAAASFGQTRLPDLGAGGFASDVNEAGHIVGAVSRPSDLQLLPALWKGGVLEQLPLGPFTSASASGVSQNGNVAGYAFAPFGSGTEPVAWIGGQIQLLPTLGDGGRALDINSEGTIVGEVFQGEERRAAHWKNGVLTLLPTPAVGEPGDRIWSVASSITNTGHILGTAHVPFGSASTAVLWKDGQISSLPLSSYLETRGSSLAAGGQVLFSGYGLDGSNRRTVVVGADGAVTELPLDEAALSTTPVALNSTGVATGYVRTFVDGLTRLQPVFWRNGARQNLAMEAPYAWGFPSSVSDAGLVVGSLSDGVSGTSIAVTWDLAEGVPGLALAPASGAAQQPVQLQATYVLQGKPQANREVRFIVGTTEVGRARTSAKGVAVLRYTIPSGMTLGPKDMMASLGGSRYTRSKLNVSAARMTLAPAPATGTPGRSATVTATLTNASASRPAAGERVTASAFGKTYQATTNASGQVQFLIPIPATAKKGDLVRPSLRFAGTAAHSSVTATATITVQ